MVSTRLGRRRSENVEPSPHETPPVKAAKIERPVTTDPMSLLPPEILSSIFARLSIEDLFQNCVLVCKKWRVFLQSNSFWISLIHREFGSVTIGDRFGDLNELISALKTVLRESYIFQPFAIRNSADSSKATVSVNGSHSSAECFFRALKNQYPRFTKNESVHYARDKQDITFIFNKHMWSLVKFDSSVFQLISCLPFQMIFDHDDTALALFFADKELNCIATINNSNSVNQSFACQLPQGSCYMAAYCRGSCFSQFIARICFPSDVRRFSRNRKFIAAINKEKVEEVKRFLSTEPRIVNLKMGSDFEKSAFGAVIKKNNKTMSKLFLSSGAAFSPQAMALAVKRNNLVVLNHFLCDGEDVNEIYDGKQLIFHLIDNAHRQSCYDRKRGEITPLDTLNLMLNFALDVNQPDSEGVTPLVYALDKSFHQGVDLFQCLLKNGADANKACSSGKTPIRTAFQIKGSLKMYAEILLENGCDLNIPITMRNGYQTTALIMAIQRDKCEVAKMFLEHGADVNGKDWKGLTARDHAELRDWPALYMEIFDAKPKKNG